MMICMLQDRTVCYVEVQISNTTGMMRMAKSHAIALEDFLSFGALTFSSAAAAG